MNHGISELTASTSPPDPTGWVTRHYRVTCQCGHFGAQTSSLFALLNAWAAHMADPNRS